MIVFLSELKLSRLKQTQSNEPGENGEDQDPDATPRP
jgi:hypothetical protein